MTEISSVDGMVGKMAVELDDKRVEWMDVGLVVWRGRVWVGLMVGLMDVQSAETKVNETADQMVPH